MKKREPGELFDAKNLTPAPELPMLRRLHAFTVHTDEYEPEEAGPLDVTIDPHGITIRWCGTAVQWQGSWKDLRHLMESEALLERELKAAKEEHAFAGKMWREAEKELARAKGDAVILPMRPKEG